MQNIVMYHNFIQADIKMESILIPGWVVSENGSKIRSLRKVLIDTLHLIYTLFARMDALFKLNVER